jgi:hypothetical protein
MAYYRDFLRVMSEKDENSMALIDIAIDMGYSNLGRDAMHGHMPFIVILDGRPKGGLHLRFSKKI